jgi:hypothetical protein
VLRRATPIWPSCVTRGTLAVRKGSGSAMYYSF